MKKKVIRTATVAVSLDILLKGQLDYLNQEYNIVAVSSPDIHLLNVANREKVSTISVAIKREIAPIQDFISLIKLYQIFRKEKPFIVHSITPKAGLLSMIAAYFAGVPIRIHQFTGLVFPTKTGLMKKLLIFLDKVLCHFATNIYPEGNGVKNDLIKYKITKKPLKIFANGNVNGVDCNLFDPTLFSKIDNNLLKKKLNINENDFVFIFIGRLVRDKGINELCQAFIKLNLEIKNIKLLLVGGFENHLNPLMPETYNILKTHKSIISVGFQPEVRPYFAIANALVFPSYREGFPNVVLQASAMGLPCIVSNINGCNEIIEENNNGIVIPSKDEKAIFNAMKLLAINEELTTQLKQNARPNIIKKFDQKMVWNAVLEEYKLLEKLHYSKSS